VYQLVHTSSVNGIPTSAHVGCEQ